MKKLLALALVLVIVTGVAYAKGYEVQKKAGDYDVTVAFDRNPPVASDNNVAIQIKDASGKIVKDALVKIDYSMPAMPGMPPMNYKVDAVLKGAEYNATLGLSMAGPWNIEVKITQAGKTAKMKFTIDAK